MICAETLLNIWMASNIFKLYVYCTRLASEIPKSKHAAYIFVLPNLFFIDKNTYTNTHTSKAEQRMRAHTEPRAWVNERKYRIQCRWENKRRAPEPESKSERKWKRKEKRIHTLGFKIPIIGKGENCLHHACTCCLAFQIINSHFDIL